MSMMRSLGLWMLAWLPVGADGVAVHPATADMAKAAVAFLDGLGAEQRAKAVFDFGDAERRNWAFVPQDRKGLVIKEMTAGQRELALALLRSGLSEEGRRKAEGIMAMEAVLREIENDRTGRRDPEKYYVSVFGKPGGEAPWGFRFEGHHLSLNFSSVAGGLASATPSFFGSNPGEVREGPAKGTRLLAREEDLGRALVKSLDEGQRKEAVIRVEAPADILNVPNRPERTRPEGIAWDRLRPEQQEMLRLVVKEQLFRCRREIAEAEWERIEKAGLGKVHFAWAGGIEPGEAHYYRVQNETFVVEYDNTQNGSNHPHTVWRDWERDFGDDLLKKHHDASHGAHAH